MKKTILLTIVILCNLSTFSQHTFSIVAVDPITGEIGSAGATCLASEDGAQDVSDIILGVGAIHTQAFWNPTNQDNATLRMEAGDSPQQIMDWLVANDINNNPSQRQYIAVDLNQGNPRSAGYTGPNCSREFIHVTGPNYAIAGNILISEQVVIDMETAFINTTGSLSDKLMASLQAAKRPGADSRCLNNGISSASAFIRVADPSDTDSSYGNLSLDLNVWITSEIFEPIDVLQEAYDNENTLSIVNSEPKNDDILIFPNPTYGSVQVQSNTSSIYTYRITDLKGVELVMKKFIAPKNILSLDLNKYSNGVYFLQLNSRDGKSVLKRILVR